MEQRPERLDYATPVPTLPGRCGAVVGGFGVLVAGSGMAVVVVGFSGPDEMRIILLGCALTAFGILCAILG